MKQKKSGVLSLEIEAKKNRYTLFQGITIFKFYNILTKIVNQQG